MKFKARSRRLNVLGNGIPSRQGESLTTIIEECRQKFGYYTVFAAIPALLASHVTSANSDKPKGREPGITEEGTKWSGKLSLRSGNRELLKKQSEFWLPHHAATRFNSIAAALVAQDDCPGAAIPRGTYSSSLPFVDSGDTTGANDTISRAFFIDYHYYNYNTFGPDNVYSFTLTAFGPNPRIEVSTTSPVYKPLIYILDGARGVCPKGTGNFAMNELALTDTRFFGGSNTATLFIQFLPLNVPLHLVIDSTLNDAAGSGTYTLRMEDVTIADPSCGTANPIDCTEFLVRQHYLDFLNRGADLSGLGFWTNEINACNGEPECDEIKRINVSAAFFLSIEFKETGYLIYKTYAAAFGPTRIGSTVPLTLDEFKFDIPQLSQGVVVGTAGWEQRLAANKVVFYRNFVARPAFNAAFPVSLTPSEYVDRLNTNAGGVLSTFERNQLVADLTSNAKTRAQALQTVTEDEDFTRSHFNRAFVLMQYFGYLRRNPNDLPDGNFDGYNFWLDKLDHFGGNFIEAQMVKAFLTSKEYRDRFGS